MRELAPLLGRSPRAVKRFINVYQFLRLTMTSDGSPSDAPDGLPQSGLLLLLAILNGVPSLAPFILDHIESAKPGTSIKALVTSLNSVHGLRDSTRWAGIRPIVDGFVTQHGGTWTLITLQQCAVRARYFSFLPYYSQTSLLD